MAMKYMAGISIPFHFLMLAPIILLMSMLVNVVVSLSTNLPDPEQVAQNTWTVKIWKEETEGLKGVVWYKNFRVLSLLLVLACFAMYFYFM